MFISDLKHCQEFIAGDDTLLRELLHPDKQPLSIRYSLAYAVSKPGQVSFKHRLSASEVYYILQGEGEMFIDDESAKVGPGMAVYIPPGSIQHLKNTGDSDLIFLCIVDPAWKAENETIM